MNSRMSCCRNLALFFPTGTRHTGSREKEKGPSAINETVAREHTISIHKRIHGVGFKKRAPLALEEVRKFAAKNIGTPDVRIGIRLNKAIRPKESKMPHTVSGYSCPENIMRMKIHQTVYFGSPTYLSPLSKIYKELMWMRTNR